MKKQKLNQFRGIANEMPLDISIDKNGTPHANCRYRQMKKIYRDKGEDAVIAYCQDVMDNIDKINADNAEVCRIITENLAIAKENNIEYLKRSSALNQGIVSMFIKKVWGWLMRILK